LDQTNTLRTTFGSSPDTTTVKGLRQYIALWLKGHDSAPSDGLERGCQEMAARLHQAYLATEADLYRNGEPHESLADPIKRCIEAYLHLQEVTEDIGEAVKRGDRTEVKVLDEEMVEGAEYLEQAQRDLEEWVSQPVLRCPRCGGQDDDPCPKCGLELMIPDPKGGSPSGDRSALLPLQYGKVFDTYEAVRGGKVTLSTLLNLLPTVDKEALNFENLVRAAREQAGGEGSLPETEEALVRLREGLEEMYDTARTRRMVQLQNGWVKVFRSAVSLERLRLSLLEELGGEEGAKQAAAERAAKAPQDSVSIEGM